MQNPQHESKALTHLKSVYFDAEGVARANRVRTLIFAIAGIALMALGMYLSKSGVIQGLCDILVCLSGVCLAYAGFHLGMNRTNPLLTEYTRLDRERIEQRISNLNN